MAAQPPVDLPENISRVLGGFVEEARVAFGPDLISVVLYGSGAEGALRAMSDVNVLLVLSAFEPSRAERLRENLRIAEAAIRLRAMFLLESELSAAIESFADKFADISRRHQILLGTDPFAGREVPRSALARRLGQSLLNLLLRLREAYVSRGLREEQLAAAAAEAIGPLRAGAATILELEGAGLHSPREALQKVAGSGYEALLAQLVNLRKQGSLPAGEASKALLGIIDLVQQMRQRVTMLS